ncbi:hypothetical protein ACTWQF_09705 [Streptomyces sp. 8N114]|uniref:hypothetical protein n=1 Tax=Streptomyces sp. 8N114 TaxID=3457419 RepID=UPI003FD09E3B
MTETVTPAPRAETTTVRPRNNSRAGRAGGRGWRLHPRARKFVLTCHVTVAVGWLGVEAAQFILALVGLFTGDAEMLRATRLVMELLGIELIAVLAWSSLLTGLLLALATPWGLLKQYWIVAKLVVNVTLMLAGHFCFRHWLQRQVMAPSETVSVQLGLGIVTGLALLGMATAISIYKPWGKTRLARRR